MCTNYAAARRTHLLRHFGVEPPESPWRDEIYKDYPAPIIRRLADAPRADLASFGIVPRKHIPEGVRVFDTMNARAETVGEKRSFSSAWKKLQLCLIPCESFYEPDYETGKAVRGESAWPTENPLPLPDCGASGRRKKGRRSHSPCSQ